MKGDFTFGPSWLTNNARAGTEWGYTKNFGRGEVYDLSRPLSTGGWSSRPRAYKDIPALQNLAFFAEDIATVRMGTHKLEIMGGLRALSLIGLDKRYTLNGKFYLDPRLNVQWVFPAIRVGGHDLNISLGGGGRLDHQNAYIGLSFPQ